MNEFALIRAFFAALGPRRQDVVLGVGDDCALLEVPPGQQLAVSLDTLVAGVHFLPDTDPEGLGYKCLAVGLSDLAAMGAAPAWSTLALTLPAADTDWLRAFARGFAALSAQHGVALVGGDTTRGPLSISVQVHGLVPRGTAVRRDGAHAGDLVYVSGTLGDAGLALRALGEGATPEPWLRARLERPTPRVALGQALRGVASAMIDVSDGLAADLGHILTASGVGALLKLEQLPLSPAVRERVRATGDWALPLAAGDDYELCFCAPPEQAARVAELARCLGCQTTAIGSIQTALGLVLRNADGTQLRLAACGFDHFAEPDQATGA